MVERISRYPLILDHNCEKSIIELPRMPEKAIFMTTRLDSKEYMNSVRKYENAAKIISNNANEILSRSKYSSP